jgi:hypothetical protein
MEVTLDQYLAGVDRWKSAVQSELDVLSIEEQRSRLLEVRRAIEAVIKSPLPELPASQATT